MKNLQFVNVQIKTKHFFELSKHQINEINKEKTIIRLMNGDSVVKTFKGPEAKSAIVSLALDNNNRVFLKNIDDLLRTARDAKFWNNKKMLSDQKRGFANG